MASSLTQDKIGSNFKLIPYDHDPGATTALFITPDGGTTDRIFDMRDYECFGLLVMLTVPASSSGITKVEIVASDSADMSTNVTVIKDSGTIDADAVGDYVFLECGHQEIAQQSSDGGISPGLRYVAGRVTCSNLGDEAVAVYMGIPKHCQDGLTATAIA